MQQLPLPVRLRDASTFDNFLSGANAEALHALRSGLHRCLWFFGAPGTGKTHLLQAACATSRAGYLGFDSLDSLPPAALEGLAQLETLCLDDVDRIVGQPAWESSLFATFNAAAENGTRLVLAARGKPGAVDWLLPDLASRLQSCVAYHLKPLDEPQRIEALRMRAHARGLDLPDDTVDYLLKRMPRDQSTLFNLIDELDVAALAAQRRLTVPFVKAALGIRER